VCLDSDDELFLVVSDHYLMAVRRSTANHHRGGGQPRWGEIDFAEVSHPVPTTRSCTKPSLAITGSLSMNGYRSAVPMLRLTALRA